MNAFEFCGKSRLIITVSYHACVHMLTLLRPDMVCSIMSGSGGFAGAHAMLLPWHTDCCLCLQGTLVQRQLPMCNNTHQYAISRVATGYYQAVHFRWGCAKQPSRWCWCWSKKPLADLSHANLCLDCLQHQANFARPKAAKRAKQLKLVYSVTAITINGFSSFC